MKRYELKHKGYDANELLPLKAKPKTFPIASYDIETATKYNHFIQGGFIDENGKYKSHLDRDEMIEYMLEHTNSNTRIFATFNKFDYFGLFKHTKDWQTYGINMRGNLLIWKEYKHMNFYDSMSYCKSSVENIGIMLNLPKLKFNVSKNTLNMSAWKMRKLVVYNKRDCEVTRQFMIQFQELINKLGGQIGQTIGSTAMDLFRRKYLRGKIHHEYCEYDTFADGMTIKEMIFNAYHGGRTEMFKRGYDRENIYYKYDFNSLYPSVMLNEYPQPSSCVYYEDIDGKLTTDAIMKYEGITYCEVVVPYMYFPILPTHLKDKLLFPIGKFTDYFTNCELRLALENGVKITKIWKSITYTHTFKPFVKWVKNLYALRLDYKKHDNIVYTEIVKSLLNNLYGKFGMRHVNKMEVFREDERDDENYSQEGVEYEKGFGYGFRETPIECKQSYIIPIFAVYTTAYGRIKLWKKLVELNGIYCDTDSVFSLTKIKDSSKLGELKLEGTTKGLNIVKQKHYSEKDYLTGKTKYKVKGLTLARNDDKKKEEIARALQFEDSINGNDIKQMRIIGLKESMKGKYELNEVIYITKKFDLRDNKRTWIRPYSKDGMRDSQPLILGFKNKLELQEYYDSIV